MSFRLHFHSPVGEHLRKTRRVPVKTKSAKLSASAAKLRLLKTPALHAAL